MDPTATGTIEVAAPPARVYSLISDLDSLGSLAEETVRLKPLSGTKTAGVGTRFRGSQRRGARFWTTVSTVTDASPGSVFAFDVKSLGVPVARWQYQISPSATGCTVTESTWDRRPSWFLFFAWAATGVRDRAAVNKHNITQTLQRLKAKAETP